ncbi:MAG: SHOCT domain-containing protein [Dermatophilaceae bacterium]|nr:SHOCT domain-containing protein [Dermatophilaceae bacterium]
MMWDTGLGLGAGMWLLMVVVTVAFWLLVAVAVREVLAPSHRLRARRRRRRQLHPLQRNGGEERGPAPATRPGGVGTGPRASETSETVRATMISSGDALSALQDRLARGDIDVDEYAQIRRALVQSHPAVDVDDPAGSGVWLKSA